MIDLTGIVKQVTKSSNSMNYNGKVNTNTFKAFCGKDEYNKYIYRKLRRDTNKTAEDVANYLMDNWKYNQFSAEVIPNDVAKGLDITPSKIREAIKLLVKAGVMVNWNDVVKENQLENKVLIRSKYWSLFNPLKFNYTTASMFTRKCNEFDRKVNDKDTTILIEIKTAYPYRFPNTDYSDVEDVDLREEVNLDEVDYDDISKDNNLLLIK